MYLITVLIRFIGTFMCLNCRMVQPRLYLISQKNILKSLKKKMANKYFKFYDRSIHFICTHLNRRGLNNLDILCSHKVHEGHKKNGVIFRLLFCKFRSVWCNNNRFRQSALIFNYIICYPPPIIINFTKT